MGEGKSKDGIAKAVLSFWYRHCERVTSTGDYIRELDGLRFLALGMVFLIHINHAVIVHPGVEESMNQIQKGISAGLEFGALGVQLFFCISGFILGLPFARAALQRSNPISLKRFYQRRLTRLEPPLIIHLTFMLGIYVVFTKSSFTELLPHYGATVTYLHSHLFGFKSPLNPMTWSLEVEAQFYLATPLLCFVFRIPNLTWRRLSMLGVILAFGIFGGELPRTVLPTQLPYFFAGFLLADIYLIDWKENPKSSRFGDLFAVVSVAGFAITCVFHKSIPLVNSITALWIFTFFYAVFRGVLFRRLFCNRFLATVGGMCYTFYLYHLIVIMAFSRLLSRWFEGAGYFEVYGIYLILIGVVNFLVCSLLFVLFERPFMQWRPRAGDWLYGLPGRNRKGAEK